LLLGLGFYWEAIPSWLIGIGADYSAISQTSSSWQANVTNAPGNNGILPGKTMTANGGNVQLSNRYNVFISPAYAIDKDKLAYLKVGYSQVYGQLKRPTTVTSTMNGTSTTYPTTTAGQTSNSTVGGYLVGLGYKQIITDGLYGFVEGNYMGYSKFNYSYTSNGTTSLGSTNTNVSSSQSLNTYLLLVGVGYTF
jgi:outer membrane immunogenic protein